MGHIKIVQALLSVDGIKINAFNTDGYAALISSSLNGHLEVVKELLQVDGIDVYAYNHFRKTTSQLLK
jgi:ankyrin repeat protein